MRWTGKVWSRHEKYILGIYLVGLESKSNIYIYIYQSKYGKSTGKSNDILQFSKFWIMKHKNGAKDLLNCS